MDLAAKRSALLQSKTVMRFACVLVAVGFLVSSVVTPRARAVVIEATAAFGAATATAAINGTCATTLFTGMSTTAASAATVSLMGEYAAATGAASSGAALAATIGTGTIATAAGVLVLSAAAGYALYRFIVWLQDEKGLEAGGEAVSIFTPGSVTFPDGSMYIFCTFDEPGTLFSIGSDNVIYNRYFVKERTGVAILGYSCINCYNPETGDRVARTFNATDFWGNSVLFGFGWNSTSVDSSYHGVQLFGYDSDGNYVWSDIFESCSFEKLFGIDSSCVNYGDDWSLDPLPEFKTWPLEVPEGDALVIHTGIENLPLSDPETAAEQIMQNAVDGNLAPVITVEADPRIDPDAAPVPSDPNFEDVEDVDELGLPSLGEALTRRFPFSIPWDIARGFTLLAAPPKTPYFEVDFYAPISDLVGGWQGSTTIVLDFSQFESLGRLSRWTSTIGFCLFLASATKRFIWTA